MRILISLIIALFSFECFATVTPDQEYILNTQMGPAAHKVQLGTLVQKNQNIIVGKYSFAVQGGSSSLNLSPILLLTDLKNPKSYVTIPANAIITNVWVNTITTKLSSTGGLYGTGSASVGMSVMGVTNDLMDLREGSTAFYQLFAGKVLKGTTTTWIKVGTTAKNVSINISNNPITAGKFNAYIEYVLGD